MAYYVTHQIAPMQWTPPHTQAVVDTIKIKTFQAKHYFRKNGKFEGLSPPKFFFNLFF